MKHELWWKDTKIKTLEEVQVFWSSVNEDLYLLSNTYKGISVVAKTFRPYGVPLVDPIVRGALVKPLLLPWTAFSGGMSPSKRFYLDVVIEVALEEQVIYNEPVTALMNRLEIDVEKFLKGFAL